MHSPFLFLFVKKPIAPYVLCIVSGEIMLYFLNNISESTVLFLPLVHALLFLICSRVFFSNEVVYAACMKFFMSHSLPCVVIVRHLSCKMQ